MILLKEAKYLEKKSKFFAYLYSLETLDEVALILGELTLKHKKANHICYAYIFENEEVFKNDGEVGQPGKTLLALLQEHNMQTHMLVVAREFGGIKLGPGGVSRAFKAAAKGCF